MVDRSIDVPPLIQHLPHAEIGADPDALLDGFVEFVAEQGISLYDAQEEAVLELLAGNHVILNTPTGSGKSLVGVAAHFAALAAGKRSVYTAPIKALVSEKFFALCRDFGSERVGMITGDASVNPDAPIICCTAEILANWALRDGNDTDVDVAVVDEFHYYGDPQRGWAWQVPLIELSNVQFLLMSATLGRPDFFAEDLTNRTGRETALVQSATRPVPLDFVYRRTTLHASIEELLESNRAPIYLVHFTQREATEAAQGYLSLDPLSKTEKTQIKEAIGGFRFDSPVGKDLKRYLLGGVGVHHAGLLPKYRLLVERLAQDGLLKIICGTDTLGVGVNVPIRSVLFTQLCKYDGIEVRTLSNREFAQIAGRAGRKGFDDEGTVWVQAPEHVVDNLRAEEKAQAKSASSGKKAKKVVKKKPPERGYAHWTEDTFTKMVNGEPEALRSNFKVNHQMVMSLLDRPVVPETGIDGCDSLKRLLQNNHEPRRRKREHIKRTVAIYRSLVDADLLEFPAPGEDEFDRKVRVNFDLQDEFALHQPLSLWAIEAITQPGPAPKAPEPEDLSGIAGIVDDELDPTPVSHIFTGEGDVNDDESAAVEPAPPPEVATTQLDGLDQALHLLTIIESVMENPGVIIAAQVNKAKDALMAEMKSTGVEYDERIERLAEVEPPQPEKRWLYDSFDRWRGHHPWVGSENVRPKSIVRDMFEQVMTFTEFVEFYGLKRSEGVVLRYLSDVYKGLIQNIPVEHKSEELEDLIDWLGTVVRQVDSSLIDEWEALQNPTDNPDAPVRPPVDPDDVTANPRTFGILVRNAAFKWVRALAFRTDYSSLIDCAEPDSALSTLEGIQQAMAPYWEEYDSMGTDADARSSARFIYEAGSTSVTQILADPDGNDEWRLRATVDVPASREAGAAVLILDEIERL